LCPGGSLTLATTKFAEAPPPPLVPPGATFLPDHRYHQGRPAAGAGGGGSHRRPRDRGWIFLGARRAPEPFDPQGRGGIESARLPSFGTFVGVRQGGKVEWEGRTRWDPAAPACTRIRLFGNEWLFSSRSCRLADRGRKDTSSRPSQEHSLRSNVSTWAPISVGQHACLARPSRLHLPGTPRATGPRSSGEGGGDEQVIGTNACG
jgi:hypothetical protein